MSAMDEGDWRWLKEGCECERRGLAEDEECIYDVPCPNAFGQALIRADKEAAPERRNK